MSNDNPDSLLRADQVSRRTGVCPHTVRRWIKTGVRGVRLVATKTGAGWRVSPADLDAFTAELTRQSLPDDGPRSGGEPATS